MYLGNNITYIQVMEVSLHQEKQKAKQFDD